MSRVVRMVIFQGILLFGTIVSVWAAGQFVDNKDGTITDIQTSLMWQKSDDGTERIWDDAIAYCESLELAGHTDWVLPKIHMLENLIEPSFSPTINPLFSVNPSYYWSSSESHISVKSAKYVNFFYGNTYAFSKDNTYYSICVRDTAVPLKDPLEVSLQFETKSATKPFEVRLTSNVTGGTKPYFYEWDFGDGDFSSRSNPVHIFLNDGVYEIDLTVSDNDGTIAIAKKEILLPLVDEPVDVVGVEPEAIETLKDQKPTVPVFAGAVDELLPEVVDGGKDVVSGSDMPAVEENLGAAESKNTTEEMQLETPTTIQETVDGDDSKTGIVVLDTDMGDTALLEASLPQIGESKEETKVEVAVSGEKVEPGIVRETGAEKNTENIVGTILSDVGGEKPVLTQEVFETKDVVEATKSKGILTVYASKNSLPAQMASGEQGLLSYSFMNALGGDADWNKDGTITARELKGYLGLAIDNLSGGQQEAEVSLNDGDFSLCAVGGGVTHILTVGVENYREETLVPLSFAGSSANSISQILTEKCSSWKNLVLTGEKSSRANIFRALVKMRQNIGAHDTFVFYFAGGFSGTDDNLNLLTYDTLPELRNYTGILLNDLTSLLEKIPAANIIMLFETGPYAEK